jgi:proline iminopeptidase
MSFLSIGDGHRMYYEEHGSPSGKPAVVLHGGPGGGLRRGALHCFDLTKWRVILYDQRGCGRSTPFLETLNNTTWHLVADIERLRTHLEIKSWTVFGGSWGSTLALAYTSRHPAAVSGLILRGIYLAEPWETHWLYEEGGASRVRPREWSRFVKGSKGTRRLLHRYERLLQARKTRRAAARSWTAWEHSLSFVKPPVDRTTQKTKESLAVLETHYFTHNCWLRPGELLAAARRIRVPTTIVQGQLDLVCPAASAVALAAAIPGATLHLVEGAGHSVSEPAIRAALRAATKYTLDYLTQKSN